MTLRLSVSVLILLMVTLISLQHPLTVLNSDESQNSSPGLGVQQYKEKGTRNYQDIHKRRASKNVETESQNLNQDQNLNQEKNTENKNNQDKKRKKRLETEEEGIERNQFYKSINEETKHDINPEISKNIKGEEFNPKFIGDLKSPVKINVANAIRPARQAAGDWGEVMDTQPNHEWMFKGGNKPSDDFNAKSNGGGFLQTLKTYAGHRRGRECLETPEMEDVQRFSPDTLETIRKINPLTIGDQVSQMIHDRNCNTKNKVMSKSSFGPLQNEAQVADLSSGASSGVWHDTDDVTLRQAAAYDKQQPSKGVQKQCPSNDYGFSVIILAGDPLKMGGSGTQSETEMKEGKSLKKKQKDCEADYSEAKSKDINKMNVKNLNIFTEQFPNKELYVPKTFDANVDFPVYDKDLTYVPDPFNGLLEEDLSADPWNKEDNRLLLGDTQKEPAHMIHVRDIQKKNSNKNAANNGGRNGNSGNNGVKNRISAKNGVKNRNSGDNCVTLGISNICDNSENSTTNGVRNENNKNKNGDKRNNTKCFSVSSNGATVRSTENVDDDREKCTTNETPGTQTDAVCFTTPSSQELPDCDSDDATLPEDDTINGTSKMDEADTSEKMSSTLPGPTGSTDLQSEEDTPTDIESFGDLVINLNDTSCQSWGIYYNNTDNNINNRNVSKNYNKGNIKTKLFSH